MLDQRAAELLAEHSQHIKEAPWFMDKKGQKSEEDVGENAPWLSEAVIEE